MTFESPGLPGCLLAVVILVLAWFLLVPVESETGTGPTPHVITAAAVTAPVGTAAAVTAMPAITPEPTLRYSDSLQTLDQQESDWRARDIDAYTITVSDTDAWRRHTYTLTVEGGAVVDVETACVWLFDTGDTCDAPLNDLNVYTVPGLFDHAYEAIRYAQYSDLRVVSVEYDIEYGFPREVVFNDLGVTDGISRWFVESFAVVQSGAP